MALDEIFSLSKPQLSHLKTSPVLDITEIKGREGEGEKQT